MTKQIKYRKNFKKQIKKILHNSSWQRVFQVSLPKEIDKKQRPPFDFIVYCLANNAPIPEYFYVHSLLGYSRTIGEIKRQIGKSKLDIKILELHFDGHTGDHLLIYADSPDMVVLIAIGTHSELFG